MNNKSKHKFWVDIASLLPFLLMSGTGIIMLFFHSGSVQTEQSVIGITGYNWYFIHKVLVLTSTAFAILHISLQPQWLKNVAKGNMFPKSFTLKMSFWLLVIFLLNAVLSLSSWLIVDNSTVDAVLHGLHSKTGLLLIIIFIFHLVQHFKWLRSTCKSIIEN